MNLNENMTGLSRKTQIKKTIGMIPLENISLEEKILNGFIKVQFLQGKIMWWSVNYTCHNNVDHACWPFLELMLNY